MPTLSRVGKRERPRRSWLHDTFENLRCRLTWVDVLTGIGLSVVIAVLLTGLRFQRIPDYRVGTIAPHEVRAPQNVVYEDVEATQQRRAAAMAAVPAVYELDWQMIDAREQDVARYFAAARALLVERGVPATGPIPKDKEAGILAELESLGGGNVAPEALPALLKRRFSVALEGQLIKTLDTVLRGGIVADKARFVKDQQTGVVLRDSISPVERPLAEGYRVRDVQDARIIIEPVVVRILASRRHRRASATELRGLIATQRALDDIVEFGRANAAFHNRIISLAGNQTLSIMADVLNEIVERAIAALGESRGILSAAARRRSLRSQEHLVELIEAGAAEEAESHWRRHLENAARRHPEGLGTKIVELLDHD